MPSRLLRVAVFWVVVLVAWHLVAVAEIWSPYLFPSPVEYDALFPKERKGLPIDGVIYKPRG